MSVAHPLPLAGRVALVTSGHKRLGRAIALHLGAQGADVAVQFRHDRHLADEVVDLLRAQGRRAEALQAELTDTQEVSAVVAQASDRLGGLDLLVAAAASYRPTPVETCAAAQLDQVLAENARAPVALVLACRPWLAASRDGRAIVLGDLAGVTPFAGYLAHSMAKAALHAGVRALAAELAPTVAVNAVIPGAVLQPASESDRYWQALQAKVPMGEVALADAGAGSQAVVDAVHYLATCSRYVTGSFVTVDGGRTARW